jgi:hypothetical protein
LGLYLLFDQHASDSFENFWQDFKTCFDTYFPLQTFKASKKSNHVENFLTLELLEARKKNSLSISSLSLTIFLLTLLTTKSIEIYTIQLLGRLNLSTMSKASQTPQKIPEKQGNS